MEMVNFGGPVIENGNNRVGLAGFSRGEIDTDKFSTAAVERNIQACTYRNITSKRDHMSLLSLMNACSNWTVSGALLSNKSSVILASSLSRFSDEGGIRARRLILDVESTRTASCRDL